LVRDATFWTMAVVCSRGAPAEVSCLLAKRCYRSWASEAPVPVSFGIEPDEPQQSIEMNTGEQVSDFCWLVNGCTCLSDQDRIVG
jgi:hypothetical protein